MVRPFHLKTQFPINVRLVIRANRNVRTWSNLSTFCSNKLAIPSFDWYNFMNIMTEFHADIETKVKHKLLKLIWKWERKKRSPGRRKVPVFYLLHQTRRMKVSLFTLSGKKVVEFKLSGIRKREQCYFDCKECSSYCKKWIGTANSVPVFKTGNFASKCSGFDCHSNASAARREKKRTRNNERRIV